MPVIFCEIMSSSAFSTLKSLKKVTFTVQSVICPHFVRLFTKFIQQARMPASRRVSQRQLDLLLTFAEANKDIALGRFTRGPQGSQTTQLAWETVTLKLNAVADGVTKTADKWRRYWIEWKAKTKNKAADIRRSHSKTGGGPSRLAPLNELEERVLQLIGRVSVEGLPGVQIPFPIPPSQQTSSQPQPGSQPSTSRMPIADLPQSVTVPTSSRESFSQMEEEWLEDSPQQSSPVPSISPQLSTLPPPTAQSPRPRPTPPQSPLPPMSSPLQSPPAPPQSPTPQSPSPQLTPQRRRRQRLIRNRDVPQWARSLEERRLAIEERHARALRRIADTIDRRLGNIEHSLNDISNKLGNS